MENFTLHEVSLYPKPTTTVPNIKRNSNLKRATIYSVLGTKVLKTTSKTITTSNLKSGLYVITIETENGSVSTKNS
ncbi:T9SS type A sorting domain-containing protein [Lacinutrix sp. MEBiC02595]